MKRTTLVLAILALSLSLIACSASPAPSVARGPMLQTGAPAIAPAATAAPAMPPAAPGLRGGSTDSAGVPKAASAERMIVYNVQVGIEVADAEKAVSDVSTIVAQFKGYVSGSNMSRDSKGRMTGTVTIRVPAESLDAAQKQIEAVGLKVLSRNRNSNDVTDQFTDLNARLNNLQAAEKELRDLLTTTREKTGKAEDILAVYNQLTQVRGQIDQIQGQMNVLSKTSTFATLTISLVPHEEVQVVDPEAWLPNQTAREALRALVQALQGLANVAIWGFLFFLPLLVVFVLPFLILVLIIRSVLRRRTKRPLVTPG